VANIIFGSEADNALAVVRLYFKDAILCTKIRKYSGGAGASPERPHQELAHCYEGMSVQLSKGEILRRRWRSHT